MELYNSSFFQSQLNKYLNRKNNHWRNHISLAKRLVADYAPKQNESILDLGCSIGTFAIEFALDGYRTIGLDLNHEAIQKAEKLANELGCNPKWICDNAGSFKLEEKVDIVICFDLLEHLSNEIIIKTLSRVRENLNYGGIFIFHTFPTEYDHIFFKGALTCLPLIPFKFIEEEKFDKIVKWYSHLLDIFYFIRYRKTHKNLIKRTIHPNPLSKKRLSKFLTDTGFKILTIKMSMDSINPLKPGQGKLAKKHFTQQPAALRSLYGAASLIR